MRSTTEHLEGVETSTTLLVGKNAEGIFQNAYQLLTDQEAYQRMSKTVNLYGNRQVD